MRPNSEIQADSLPIARPAAIGIGAHVPALDGLRGLAILLVMVFHQFVIEPSAAVDRAASYVVNMGWCGVDLFFVLSGFLITGILLDSRDRPSYFRNFYARRTLRIFPLYYAIVFLCFVILPQMSEWVESGIVREKLARFAGATEWQAWYWLYLSNFAIAQTGSFQHGVLGITWSLAIEEQFYIIWPAVVFLVRGPRLKHICVGMIVMAVALRLWLVVFMESHPVVPYVITPTRLDGLAVGALLAIRAREGAGLPALRSRAGAVTVSALAGVAGIAIADALTGWNFHQRFGFSGPESGFGKLMQVAGYLLLPIGFGGLLVLSVTAPRGSACERFFGSAFMRMLGKYSYALYLFHLPVRAVIRDLLFGPGTQSAKPLVTFPVLMGSLLPAQILFWIMATAAALALAWLSWNLYEKPFLKLKRFFEYRPASAAG